MTHAGLHVDHAALAGAAQGLVAGARRIGARLDELEGDLAPLRSQWTGAARGAYDQAKAQWDTAVTEMVQLLAQVGQGVELADAEYRAADQRGATRFGG